MSAEEKTRVSGEAARSDAAQLLPTVNPQAEKESPSASLHPIFYIVSWIGFSSSVILFNKWLLDTLNFRYPVILTTYHLTFSTVVTQLMARWTTMLDGRKTVKMTGRVYLRAVVPIGIFFSLSLICGNLTYLYLSVAFIQMLKATTPVAVLISGWILGVTQPNLRQFLNVSAIVVGVIIASFGEIHFVPIGVAFQIGGIVFEALRLTMVQRLLSSADFKMDPLVSLYYFAPICAVMNGVVALIWEVPRVSMSEVYNVGFFTFFLNGFCAFMLNVSVVFLIGKTSAVVLTLCGVLKDIMLVVASMIIWGTEVTAVQFFGYSIALGGMVYYKLGYEQLKGYAGEAGRHWAEFGARKPVLRKAAVIVFTIMVLVVMFGMIAPTYAPGYDTTKLTGEVSNRFKTGAQ
ncbi:triose phosphate/3-phosphoglycerate/phosphate translocator [Drechmeria coniospora]|uniref:Triose phosphate/3-phosphoglycerate/phosphate translocator n=1 Tax=Drechmeria coniospora TaxID=98403 RepID=A0A151GDU2_DRECN|nr:triose phosphate/3-phosphoglycerate/phosphate translocator [Drechmeria coniospora]KYK55262.1 triose phosphate/3-phosphoglycerate/phosphate translocator [Drechmeria coniospora]